MLYFEDIPGLLVGILIAGGAQALLLIWIGIVLQGVDRQLRGSSNPTGPGRTDLDRQLRGPRSVADLAAGPGRRADCSVCNGQGQVWDRGLRVACSHCDGTGSEPGVAGLNLA